MAGKSSLKCAVVFDFDNTITPFDVLDDIIERFSLNRGWVAIEKEWKAGKIGSRECLERQLGQVKLTRQELLRYLSGIKISPYFRKIVLLLKKYGVKPLILSDNFDSIIRFILRNNAIAGVKIYANRVKFKGNRLLPSFPYTDKDCWRCAHCKTKNLPKNKFNDKITIFIGDGLSDICPAEKADLVFAKASLLRHFRENNIQCVQFQDLKEIYNYFKEKYDSGRKNK